MKLNNKGFTLVELLAVVVILSILISIMVPSVNYLIDKNKEDNYEKLKSGIISAAKVYLSDNRYEIDLKDKTDGICDNGKTEEDINKVGENTLTDSKLLIKTLVDNNNLSTDSEGNIINPKDKSQILDLNTSYILIKYQCNSKDYTYTLEDTYLKWKTK